MAGNQWKKGQSGNPEGSPKGLFSIAKELKKQMGEVDLKDPEGRTHGVMRSRKLSPANYGSNGQGSIKAVSEVFDRMIGRPAQAVTLDATLTENPRPNTLRAFCVRSKLCGTAKDSELRVQ